MRLGAVELVAPLACAIVARLHRLSGTRAGLVVLFHLVSDRQGDPRRELVSPLERRHYERQLRHLSRQYEVVPLERLPAAVAARRRGARHPVSVTFDDDEPEHVTHALPALRAEGLSATFFLSGSWLDPGDGGVWWYDLQRAADAGADLTELVPGESELFRVAYAVARLPPAERRAAALRLRELAGGTPRKGISAPQAGELVRAGQSIGFHTRHHYALPVLDDQELEQALTEARTSWRRWPGAAHRAVLPARRGRRARGRRGPQARLRGRGDLPPHRGDPGHRPDAPRAGGDQGRLAGRVRGPGAAGPALARLESQSCASARWRPW